MDEGSGAVEARRSDAHDVGPFMRAAVTMSGARRGFLIVGRGNELTVAAMGDTSSVALSSGRLGTFDIDEATVREVVSTGRGRTRHSIVCLPIALPDSNDGAIYLEMPDGAAPARVEDLEWLATAFSAAAIANNFHGQIGTAHAAARAADDSRLGWDMIPALAWIGAPDGGFEDGNKQWFEYTGLTRETAVGFGFVSAFHPDDVDKVIKVWTDLCTSAKPGGVEARMLRHDGEARWFVLRAVPLLDDDGNVIRWYGVNTDIDELKRIEFELAQSQLVMAVAQRIIETGTWSWDMATDVFTCSPECASIVGLDANEITFETLSARVHPDDREMVAEAHQRALQGEELNVEHRFLLPDGTVKFIHARGRLILDEVQSPRAYIGTIADVTETRLAEEKIQSSLEDAQRAQASLAEAQKLSHVGSYRIKPSKREVVWSEETYNIYGFDTSIALSFEMISERVHPSDREMVAAVSDRGLRERQPWEIEHRLLLPDGSIRYVHCVTRVETNPEEEPEVFGAIIDITERVKSEEALQKAQADIVRMNRLTAMGAVTVSIAHEMNQPLMAIVTNAATCLSWLDRDVPDVAEAKLAAERLVEEGKRAGDVLLNVRSMARNSGPSMDMVDIGEVISHVLRMLRTEFRIRQIDVFVSVSTGIPAIRGDKVQLQQVLLNLMLNAAEAIGANDGARRIDLTAEADGSRSVVVRVEDTGEGIDPIASERIFEAFFSTKQQGTGMGLAISKSIISAHSGTLSARPRAGGGAVFEFSIPFAGESR
ncbi:PAS domain-containing sensor histidine kinase [Rhizobium grahamii]|uniref:histidine kinase n=1 Tax=Rhizobium grahamii CCGE 502 TaxID=990285 RepID=S3HSD4_9HYPH|nr:PAS domain-containing protein [Rhizobium grahamii]EPE96136.1 PAS/PAC sensor signal transduction histidine kinase [Rhizobium grahamii CCGE 502]